MNIRGLAFSPDGRTLATSSLDGSTVLWDLARGRPRVTLKDGLPGSAYSVAFSPDGSTVATAHGELSFPQHTGRVQLWDAASGALRSTVATTDRIARSVVFSRDGRRIGVIDEERTARVCDVTDGRVLSKVMFAEPFLSAAFAPDLATLAACDAQGIRLVEVATGHEVAAIGRLPNRPLSLAFSPDGKALVCGVGTPMTMSGMGGMSSEESFVKVWDLSGEAPKERAKLKGVASWRPGHWFLLRMGR